MVGVTQTDGRQRFGYKAVLAILLIVQAGLLAWTAFRFTPAVDEPGHFIAGVSHWQLQNFSWYRVNPPVPRMLATFIPYVMGARIDVPVLPDAIESRPEMAYGYSYFFNNPEQAEFQLGIARLVAMIWALAGTVVIFLWSRSIWGSQAGLFSAALWVFSPLVIANSQLIMPDVASATMGLVAGYAFSHWLKKPDYEKSVLSGVALGVAQLTKFTLIVLVPLWLLVWCIYGIGRRQGREDWLKQARQMFLSMLVALLVINLGYSFVGTGTRLKDYRFISEAFVGEAKQNDSAENRFYGTWLGEITIPLPTDVLLGIDLQQRDFEGVYTSYLRGQERHGGWYHYYIYGYIVKEPVGFLLLLTLAITTSICRFSWRSELVLVLVPMTIFIIVSSKTGFNHHLRYVLPAVPYMAVWCGRLMEPQFGGRYLNKVLLLGLLLMGIGESLSVYPYSYAHFNLLAGGSADGYRHLASSNLGWGQEAHLVAELREKFPDIKIAAELLPVYAQGKNSDEVSIASLIGLNRKEIAQRLKPGTYAIHASSLGSSSSPYRCFERFVPIQVLGYTVRIYNIGPAEIEQIASALGTDEE